MNAIEITWILPYKIPSDNTKATISCKDSAPSNNYVSFYQSSLVTKGFGKGSCFYVDNSASSIGGLGGGYSHNIVCENIGKLKQLDSLIVAF